MSSGPETVVEIARWRAAHQAGRRAFTFLVNGETEGPTLTYGELDRHARAIAAILQRHASPGERAILVYPQSLDFITAFLGCLYAGIVAVPSYVPSLGKTSRGSSTLLAIARDAGPLLALTTSKLQPKMSELFAAAPELQHVRWLATDGVTGSEHWREPDLVPDRAAFLQYTSGSTSFPKGVIVTHANVVANEEAIRAAAGNDEDTVGVTWLPMFHDMGLIGCTLQPIYAGFHAYVMSPTAFLQNPLRWLKAISRFRVTTSGGPNFAYDLCTARSNDALREELDLGHWTLAFCGAEPVRARTLERFADAFRPCGFRPEAFYPCFGLAEATLLVSGGPGRRPPTILAVEPDDLTHNRVSPRAPTHPAASMLVGCGRAASATDIRIVDPDARGECPPGRVGEIWVRGPGVAAGYWNRDAETEETFRATLAGSDDGPFLRTGDLGFVDDGEVFVSGRLKDLVVIDGRNHHPPDIEFTVETQCPAVRAGGCAAFGISDDGAERLVVVAEMDVAAGEAGEADVKAQRSALVKSIRRSVAERHGVPVHAVSLVRPGRLPRTSSGKLQRALCRDRFLSGSMAEGEHREIFPQSEQPAAAQAQTTAVRSGEEIRAWLSARLARHLGIAVEEIATHASFADYGLGSKDAVLLVGELEQWLACRVSPTLLYRYPNIDALASHLGGRETGAVRARTRESGSQPIAIVGMSCRFPGGADDPDTFWGLLRAGTDAVGEVPRERWDIAAYYDPDPAAPGKMYTRNGAFLSQVDGFDARFFGISPREAAAMDPQHRLLLEAAWEALERACHNPAELSGSRTGAFIGISSHDYAQLMLQSQDEAGIDAYFGTGNAFSVAAGRLAYLLGLQGPTLAVDTACSSSLVAVHLACQSLRTGECDLALAGGVNLILSPEASINFCRARMLAKDGRCKTFDAHADGYGRGEGCGIVVLQRLADALADRVPILAVIEGSGINQDGRSNGLTAPNGAAQRALIRDVLHGAGLQPSDIGYVEAHGTGTSLGDPIELEAVAAELGEERGHPLLIGSVKTNIGHLEAAAGIAGLIKTVLSIQHGQIPPNLHLTEPNPLIDWSDVALRVPTRLEPWAGDGRRIGAVSSFGFSGTNAHVIVAEPPHENASAAAEPEAHLLLLSAKVPATLRQLAGRFATHVAAHPEQTLRDVCYTANACRPHHEFRAAFVAQSRDALVRDLQRYAGGHPAAAAEGRPAAGGAARLNIGAPPGRGTNGAGIDAAALKRLAEFYVTGAEIDWSALAGDGRKLPLPTYPFQRERHWLASAPMRARTVPSLRAQAGGHNDDRIGFTHRIGPHALRDHKILGQAILPASAYIEMALAAIGQTFKPDVVILEGIAFKGALPLAGEQDVTLLLTGTAETATFEITAAGAVLAGGKARRGATAAPRFVDPETIELRQHVGREDFYRQLAARGHHYGPSFQCVRRLSCGSREAVGLVEVEAADRTSDYEFHPCLLDGCLQVVGATLAGAHEASTAPLLVVGVERLSLRRRPAGPVWCHARLRTVEGTGALADLIIYDETGVELAALDGLQLKQRPARPLAASAPAAETVSRGIHGEIAQLAGGARRQALLTLADTELRRICGLGPSFVLDAETRLKDLGLDSLMAMDLVDDLAAALKISIPATLLSDIATIADLIDRLDRQVVSASPGEARHADGLAVVLDEIEALTDREAERLTSTDAARLNGAWDRVARLSESKMKLLVERLAAGPAIPVAVPPEKRDLSVDAVLPAEIGATVPAGSAAVPDAILLTGATGYLGTFLLADLLQLTHARIFCLVRARSVEDARRRLTRELARRFPAVTHPLSRIVPVCGNLAEPRLGLSDDDFRALAGEIDVIYHSGAVINFLDSYETLKPVNVQAAQAVLRLASTTRLKPVHFVSSFSVFMSPHYVNARVVPEQDGPERWEGLPNGYAQSKWVADRLMQQAIARGMPVSIYRPGFISGDSRTGECKLEDLPQRLIKACIQLGAAPHLPDAALDMTPVDFVGSAIIHLSRRRDAAGRAFNLVNPAPIPWDRLVAWMRQYGYPVEVVPFADWLEQLRGADETNALYALRNLVELTPKELLANLPPFERANAVAGLSDSTISCPSVEALLDAYFSFFVRSGFLKAPARVGTHAFG